MQLLETRIAAERATLAGRAEAARLRQEALLAEKELQRMRCVALCA
jgi:hypothetical protein